MTKPFTDATAASSDNFNVQVYGGDTLSAYQILSCHIYYDGANWQVHATEGSYRHSTIIEAGCAWDGTADELDIDLGSLTGDGKQAFQSGYRPITVATPTAVDGATGSTPSYHCQARAVDHENIRVRFYEPDGGTGWTQITTEDAYMNFQLVMHGPIDTI